MPAASMMRVVLVPFATCRKRCLARAVTAAPRHLGGIHSTYAGTVGATLGRRLVQEHRLKLGLPPSAPSLPRTPWGRFGVLCVLCVLCGRGIRTHSVRHGN